MKMTNIFITLLLALMVCAPLVMAADTNSVGTDSNQTTIQAGTDENVTAQLTNPETEKEIVSMHDSVGADVRLLQLERAITRNVLRGSEVLSVITKNHADFNVLPAQALLDDMQSLAQKAQTAPRTPIADATAAFVSIKKDALQDMSAFRKAIKGVLTRDDRMEIRQDANSIDRNQLKEISDTIKQHIDTYNSERVSEILSQIGVTDQNLIDQIQAGELDPQKIKREIANQLRDMNKETRDGLGKELRLFNAKNLVADKTLLAEAKKQVEDRQLAGDGERIQRIADNLEKRAKNLDANGFEHIGDWVQKRANDLNRIAQDFRDASRNLNNRPERMRGGQGNGSNRPEGNVPLGPQGGDN